MRLVASPQLSAETSSGCYALPLFSLAAAGSLTTCARADGHAWFNYTFLTLKERDNETGLDYFLARYYSSTQGRFTSPDEFTGGPDELYDFVDAAAENPTFYADLTNPQSLNKYQYTYNNPLNMVDPDGHCPEGAAGVLCRVAPVVISIPGLREVAAGAAAVVILAHAFDAIPGDKTAGDGSCPSCERSLKAGQQRMEQNEQKAQDNSGNQTGRGSQNPNTAEAAKEGREQHKDFAEKVKAKPGWKSEPKVTDPKTGRSVKPDAVTPRGRPVELKPNTPSGRAQGRRQLPGQERATGKRGRVVYYEPKRKKPEPE